MGDLAIRTSLIDALEADLIGPFDGPGETLQLSPSRWYLTGFLAPLGGRETEDPTDVDELGVGAEEDEEENGGPEPEAKQKNLFPASMGMSVLLPPGKGGAVRVTVSFADYVREEREQAGKRPRAVWRRVARGPFVVEVPLDKAAVAEGVRIGEVPGVVVKGRLAEAEAPGLARGTRALSVFVVNDRPREEDRALADQQFLFQVHLAVEADEGLVARPNRRDEGSGEWDDRVADLQFRDRCEWAVGHNVSVVAPAEGLTRVTRVETTWLPRHEVRRVETREEGGVETRMEALAALADGGTAERTLLPLVAAYGAWIGAQRGVEVGSVARGETRDVLCKRADEACARIREGIELLAKDPEVFEAFRLANRAMAMAARQRSPGRYGPSPRPSPASGRGGASEDTRSGVIGTGGASEATLSPESGAGGASEASPAWRLFQLAFVLMNLPALAEPTHAARDVVDLIFFPTGGGKTEAYLGVIAVTLVLRRIRARARPDGGLGVAVLLRYTLRLLTLDQLSRAATLVCALERLRALPDNRLGDARFLVGLWVGRSATANTLEQVKEAINAYKTRASAPSPCPLTHCPWCGTELERDSLRLVPSNVKPEGVAVTCLLPSCPFTGRATPAGLPLAFVDEQIYRELPSFLVATVDKFAMLPWRGETGMLFGRVGARQGERFFGPLDNAPKGATPLPAGLLPPELIVQDELHLISGPLGTMVGLYETAIDFLSTRTEPDGRRTRPKVIASTATVRRAQQQVQLLFGREHVALFPPPGIDDSETYFAQVNRRDPGRTYVGIAAPGRSMKAILLRAYIDLACAAQQAWGPKGDPAADPYMTVVGYFNSLRELGGMRRLVEDDVRSRCLTILERVPEDRIGAPNPHFARRTIQAEPIELTSRESTARIAASKARLALAHSSKEHVDVVLASNMISVGVDIDRLGLMVVAGQPKTTSEYIQASSRVGRQHPGLVVTCFNVRRPRDRSHYERFAAYHASFYRFVEAQSLTPFSGPALQRGLAGTLVAMTRLDETRATPPAAAARITTYRAIGERAVAALAERGAPKGAKHEAVRESLRDRGKSLLDAWDRYARRIRDDAGGTLYYSRLDRDRGSKHMLYTVLDVPQPPSGTDEARFAAPTSMRDVESSVHLWVERGRLGGRR